MKQFAVLSFYLVFTSLTFGQSSSLQDGNNCFTAGDYYCAIEKYKEVINSKDERQKKIAGDNLIQAKKCLELRRMADEAFKSKNFIKAKEYYLNIINENPNDETAKARLGEIKVALVTLKVSKNIVNIPSSGGKEYIHVTTEANSYAIGILPSWCTVEKFEKSFLITCTENTSTTDRTCDFNVSAGNKDERIYIRQSGKNLITLSVSKENISFSSAGGREKIFVTTNAASYTINLLPAWCTIEKYAGYFIIKCLANSGSNDRTDYFTIAAGNLSARISIRQTGRKMIIYKANSSNQLKQNYFSSIGFQSGQIAKYGIIYEAGGKKTFGFHIVARSSLAGNDDILKGSITANKTEIILGPSIKFSNRFYLNIGAGYGFYNFIDRNDYAQILKVGKAGYLATTVSLMIRINSIINLNGGAAFMDINKDIYKPEITFGLSFNLKGRN